MGIKFAYSPAQCRMHLADRWAYLVRLKAQITSGGRTHTRSCWLNLVSLRAPELGNRLGWSLAIKLTYGKRATRQAVTRVKLEQASKVKMWTPTRQGNGEGYTDREETRAGTRNSQPTST